jgi:hypothetical protein
MLGSTDPVVTDDTGVSTGEAAGREEGATLVGIAEVPSNDCKGASSDDSVDGLAPLPIADVSADISGDIIEDSIDIGIIAIIIISGIIDDKALVVPLELLQPVFDAPVSPVRAVLLAV